MTKCDHIIVWHRGHDEVMASEWKEKLKYENGTTADWCCGGCVLFKYCPKCGVKLDD